MDQNEIDEAFAKAREKSMNNVTTIEESVKETPPETIEKVEKAEETAPILETNTTTEEVVVESEETGKNLIELLSTSSSNLTTETGSESEKTFELTEEQKAKLALADEYDNLRKSPIFEAIAMGLEPDKFIEWAKELIPEDYSRYSYEQLVRMQFEKELNFSGEDLNEAVKEFMDEHALKSKVQQAVAEKQLRQSFKPTAKESSFLNNYKKIYQEQIAIQPKAPTAEDIKKIEQQDIQAIQSVWDQLKDSNVHGIKVKELIPDPKNIYNARDIQPFINPDNTLNAQGFIEAKLFTTKNVFKMLEAAKEQGRKEILKEMAAPPRKTGEAPTNITDKKTPAEQMAEYLNNPANIPDLNKRKG